jgi:hypothetical protein
MDKNLSNLIIFFVGLCIIGVVLFNGVSSFKLQKHFEDRNNICIVITGQLKSNITGNSTCSDYYCYYAPYAPPVGYENKTETLCICDCKLRDGTIFSTQVLNVKGNITTGI